MKRSAGWRLRLVVSFFALAIGTTCAELAFRSIDGYRLAAWSLRRIEAPPPRVSDRVRGGQVQLAAGVDPTWFGLDPAPRARVPSLDVVV